ncbi:MAG: heavy-metal-associated domain-containing protein [Candidatus Thermoplasmatota archaeon]
MKKLSLRVETLGFEASENDVIDELLAHEGVLAAEIDVEQETLAVAYDERKTTKGALLDHLRFFGLTPRLAPLSAH